MKRKVLVLVLAAGVLASVSLTAGADTRSDARARARATPGSAVSLVVHHRVFRAAQVVPVTVVNSSSVRILRTDCFGLARRTRGGGWQTVTRTHGVPAG